MSNQAKKQQESPNNPWTERNPYASFSSFMPNFDNASARNQFNEWVKDVSSANDVLMDCARETARRNMELAQRNAQCFYECSKEASSYKSAEDFKSKGFEMVRSMSNNCIESARENAEITSRATMEFFDLCSKRMAEMFKNCQG